MLAEIITIGDEILIGQTVDTNSAWLAENLHLQGVRIGRITSISDTPEAIRTSIDEAFSRVDLVLMTGGLGPTNDDLTKPTLAAYFQTDLVLNEEVLAGIEAFFTKRGKGMLEVNRKQAELPRSAKVLSNSRGTAQGMWLEKEGKVLISMPGIPYEMKGIMEDGGLVAIASQFETTPIIHRTILTQGIGESFLAEQIADWEKSLRDEGLSLAYLPSPGLVKLRISAYAGEKSEAELLARMNHYTSELERRVPEHIFGREKQTMAEVVGHLLKSEGATLSTAESCTGGYIAHLITSNSGSSAYFKGGVVAYANEVKAGFLSVDASDIETYGAVSEKVVVAMAEGARHRFDSTYALATSGIAGPDGGSDTKPVGTVWIAMAGPEKTIAKQFNFGNSRSRNIHISGLTALNMLRAEIIQKRFELSK